MTLRRLSPGRWTALVLTLASSGCYTWTPAGNVAPARADALRLHLVTPRPVSLGRISVNLATEIDGELVRMDADSIVVSATRVVDVTGAGQEGGSETVSIARAGIGAIDQRRISWLRSAIAGGAIAMIGGLTTALAGEGGGGRGGSGSGGATK